MTVLWVCVIVEGLALAWVFVRIGQLLVSYQELAKLALSASKLIELLATVEAHNWKAFVQWQATAKADISQLEQRMDIQ